MSMRALFDLLGVPSEFSNNLWPETRVSLLEERERLLRDAFQRRYGALIRRRCAIERLRRDRAVSRIEQHEAAYQGALAKTIRLNQKLRSVQAKLKREKCVPSA
jgi:hypothetical protein